MLLQNKITSSGKTNNTSRKLTFSEKGTKLSCFYFIKHQQILALFYTRRSYIAEYKIVQINR